MSKPGKPTLVTPVGPDTDARTFLLHAASTPPLNGWAVQVSSNVNVPAGHIYWDIRGTTGYAGFTVTVPYAGEALPGSPTWLYWRGAIRNVEGWGPWSTVVKFSADLTPPPARDPYDEWARAVLATMARPRVALVPGTIHPHGARVRELVTADMGTRWRLQLPDMTPPVFADLAVAGMTVECAPDTGWAISAITGHVDSQGHSGDYLARAIALGPLEHWRLSDPTGAFRAPYVGAVDLTPGGAGAQYVDASPWGAVWADEPDGCIGFGGGATAWLDGGDVYDFAGTAPFSFACWINPTAISADQRRIVGKESTSGYLVWLREDAAGITRYDTGGQDEAIAPGPIVLGAGWRHLVATYDGSSLRCYLDGNPGAPVASGRALPGHAGPFYVGRWSSVAGQYQFIGWLDELSIFDRALTPAEVATLYGGGI